MTAQGGENSDGRGTPVKVDEQTREARAGETGTTRFGMEDGTDTLTDDSDAPENSKDEGAGK